MCLIFQDRFLLARIISGILFVLFSRTDSKLCELFLEFNASYFREQILIYAYHF